MEEQKEKYYAHFLTTVQWFNLNTCVRPICEVFGFQVFLVGSALTKRDWRDVDVRVIYEKYEHPLDTEHHRKVLGMMISEWLASRTGLPIDFQFQTMDEANKFEGKRNALGITV